MSEFGPYDEDILNESLGGPQHDEARERLLMIWLTFVNKKGTIVGRELVLAACCQNEPELAKSWQLIQTRTNIMTMIKILLG